MASGPTPKRPRLMCLSNMHNISRENAMEIARRAMNQPFPWSSVVPKEVQEWIEAFALAHNTRPEFVFMGSLVSTAAIMGPKAKIRVRSTYQEPTNLYVICLADPGAGKSQAFRLSMTEPIYALKEPVSSMRVENYTQLGLFKHLKDHEGTALVAQEEMSAFFDLVQRRQLEGSSERQLYCSLYDGGSWIKSTGSRKSEGREEIKEACVCIGGYLQPVPFVQKHYATIYESNDGFADRILLCTPKPQLLKEDEVDEWVSKLESTGLTSLAQPYSLIQQWHCTQDIVYTFNPEGQAVYKEFADKIVDLMNDKWNSSELQLNIGNVSKDKRTMIRLSGILHVLCKAIMHCLQQRQYGFDGEPDEPSDPDFEAPTPLTREISKETAERAVNLTEYFQDQRKHYEDGIETKLSETPEQSSTQNAGAEIKTHILLRPGPFTTPRAVYKSIRFSMRTKAQQNFQEIVKELEDEGLGTYREFERGESAYYKALPEDEKRAILEPYLGENTWEDYCRAFRGKESEKLISNAQHSRLISRSPDIEKLRQYGL